MAEQGIQMDQEKLCCSICPDLLKDPVTISCGHNSCLSLTRLGEADSPRINISPSRDTEDVSAAVSEAREKLQDVPGEEWTKMSLGAPQVEVSLPHAEPKTRDEFLKYSCEITLDQNTAHKCLSVSCSMAEHKYLDPKNPSYNDHPDRFTDWCQVLCREGQIGQCYWEVERKGEVFVAVAYKSIRRVGRESDFGYDDSWALQCFDGGYEYRHDIIRTPISGPQSSRVGVYLDHRAGILSFYSVSETMTLLLRVHTTFTQPLYAGLGMQKHGASAKICNASTT